jgi:hypothetical protein
VGDLIEVSGLRPQCRCGSNGEDKHASVHENSLSGNSALQADRPAGKRLYSMLVQAYRANMKRS